jgi:hypothetical protein
MKIKMGIKCTFFLNNKNAKVYPFRLSPAIKFFGELKAVRKGAASPF